MSVLTIHRMALDHVQFPGYRFYIIGDYAPGRMPVYLQAQFTAPCNVTGKPLPQRTRKWLLSENMTPHEVVQTAFKCVLTSIEHEAREQFTYMEQPIFGPHFDLTDLVLLCTDGRATAGGRIPA